MSWRWNITPANNKMGTQKLSVALMLFWKSADSTDIARPQTLADITFEIEVLTDWVAYVILNPAFWAALGSILSGIAALLVVFGRDTEHKSTSNRSKHPKAKRRI